MIKAKALSKKFGSLVAVDNLSLDIAPGELFCFLGPNGAGKTTTIRMLIGLLKPTSGSVTLGDIDVWANPRAAKQIIGFVPDTPTLYDKLTAKEFLDFVGDIYQVSLDKRRRRIDDLLELFELTDSSNDMLSGYSHGMRQKVCIAAALLHDPKIIFLDEPTVGLDPRSAKLIKDILKELSSKGVCILMSTHILEIAERMADRVGIIKRGKLLFTGTVAQLGTQRGASGESLENLFLEMTGGKEYEDISRYLEA